MCMIIFHFSPAIYEPIRLEPMVVKNRHECYSYDTMDERRDIRCQVRSIIQHLVLGELPGEGSGSGSGRPDGPGGCPNGEGPIWTWLT